MGELGGYRSSEEYICGITAKGAYNPGIPYKCALNWSLWFAIYLKLGMWFKIICSIHELHIIRSCIGFNITIYCTWTAELSLSLRL